MVFQKPNPFPAMTHLRERAVRACSLSRQAGAPRRRPGRGVPDAAPASGTRSRTGSASPAARSRAASSSGSASPARWPCGREVLLMDEPCSALDPTSTRRIEETMLELATRGHDRDRHPQHAAGPAGVVVAARSSWPARTSPATSSRPARPSSIFERPSRPADGRLRPRAVRMIRDSPRRRGAVRGRSLLLVPCRRRRRPVRPDDHRRRLDLGCRSRSTSGAPTSRARA